MDLLLTAVYVISALTTTGLSQKVPFVERSSLGQTFQSVLQDSYISGDKYNICFSGVNMCKMLCYNILYHAM